MTVPLPMDPVAFDDLIARVRRSRGVTVPLPMDPVAFDDLVAWVRRWGGVWLS